MRGSKKSTGSSSALISVDACSVVASDDEEVGGVDGVDVDADPKGGFSAEKEEVISILEEDFLGLM